MNCAEKLVENKSLVSKPTTFEINRLCLIVPVESATTRMPLALAKTVNLFNTYPVINEFALCERCISLML